jgi:hypothetical protein
VRFDAEVMGENRAMLGVFASAGFDVRRSHGVRRQSGALGLALLGHAAARGLGVSTFVALGNRADVSTNDLLEHFEDDERTAVIALYMESFGNPRRFSQLSRRVSRRKPILAVKLPGPGSAAINAGAYRACGVPAPRATDPRCRAGVPGRTGSAPPRRASCSPIGEW